MISRKRFEALERKVEELEEAISKTYSKMESATNFPIYDGWWYPYSVPIKDILAQLLARHGLKIVRKPAQAEQFTLEEKEEGDKQC